MESEFLSVIPIPLTTKFRSRRCSDSLPLNRLDSSSDLELRACDSEQGVGFGYGGF